MRDFSTLIKNWYLKNRRNLPWRETNDPYKIWLSEIILQQTRVDQGLSYYKKFVQNYPTIKHLAEASEDAVLRDWQGLGYYSRARNLHFAAKYVVNELNGQFPTTFEGIKELKGVGDYTAAAISSIAYGLPHAVVDGNVYRVLARYLNASTPIDSTKGKKEFAFAANELLDVQEPGNHNQAMMELGALICTPKKPLCEECPLRESCQAKEKGTQLELPVKEKKTKVRNRYFHYLVVSDGEHILLNKRGGNDIWEGLYDFPLIEKTSAVELKNKDLSGFVLIKEDRTFKHILSHQRIFATFWIADKKGLKISENQLLVKLSDLDDFPMPQLLIRYLETSDVFK